MKDDFNMVLDKKMSLCSTNSNAPSIALTNNTQVEDIPTIAITNNMIMKKKNHKFKKDNTF